MHLTPSHLRIGYLPQGLVFHPEETISGYLTHHSVEMVELLSELEMLSGKIALSPGEQEIQEQYNNTLEEITRRSALKNSSAEIMDRLVYPICLRIHRLRIFPAVKKPAWRSRGFFFLLPTCCCSMNPPITWISKCWNGWKTGCSIPAPQSF